MTPDTREAREIRNGALVRYRAATRAYDARLRELLSDPKLRTLADAVSRLRKECIPLIVAAKQKKAGGNGF